MESTALAVAIEAAVSASQRIDQLWIFFVTAQLTIFAAIFSARNAVGKLSQGPKLLLCLTLMLGYLAFVTINYLGLSDAYRFCGYLFQSMNFFMDDDTTRTRYLHPMRAYFSDMSWADPASPAYRQRWLWGTHSVATLLTVAFGAVAWRRQRPAAS